MKKGILLTVFVVVVVSFIGCAGATTWKSFARSHVVYTHWLTPVALMFLNEWKR